MTSEKKPEDVVLAMGLTVPEPPAAVGAYLSWQRPGRVVTTSFQLRWRNQSLAFTGRVGREITTDQAIAAARR